MQNLKKSLVCALFLALAGCSHYSDFPPPADGASCQSVADCGSRGACWAWSCVAGSCLAVVSPDLDNAGQPTTCDMSIDGSPGTCHAGQCDPDNGTTEQCFPAFPPDCYPPANGYQCGATTTVADERDGQCERLWCLDSALTLVDKGDGWPCVSREDGDPEFKQGQCVGATCVVPSAAACVGREEGWTCIDGELHGVCVAGHCAQSCDDGNPCTADRTRPDGECAHSIMSPCGS